MGRKARSAMASNFAQDVHLLWVGSAVIDRFGQDRIVHLRQMKQPLIASAIACLASRHRHYKASFRRTGKLGRTGGGALMSLVHTCKLRGGDCFFELMGLPMRAAQPNGEEEMSLNALEMAKANFATRFQSDTSTGLIRNEAAGSRNIDRLREKAIGEAQTSLNDIRNLHTHPSSASGA